MSSRKVLVISYLFPPAGDVGVHRALRFVKHLPSFGWQPIVLTAKNAKTGNVEPSLLDKVPVDLPVYRTHSFEALNGGKCINQNGAANKDRSLPHRLVRKVPTDIWRYVAAPDEKLGWVPFAIRAGKRIIKEHNIDAIFVTGKPFSSYWVGDSLSRRFGIPWIMDLRDLWKLNRRRPPRNRWHAFVNRRLEKRFVSSAAVVVANTPGNRSDFIAAYPDCPSEKFVAITNGYDEEDFRDLENRKHAKFTIGYSGTFYFRRAALPGQELYGTYSPKSMFQAIKEIFDENVEMRSQIQLLFTGPGCDNIGGLVSEFGLTDNVKLLGWVSYRESLESLKRSHLLALMLSSGVESAGWIPSKLYQYMGARTPILAMVPPGDVANIIQETHAGTVVTPDDVRQIKTVILDAYRRYQAGDGCEFSQQSSTENFEGRQLTQHLAECLDKMTGRKLTTPA